MDNNQSIITLKGFTMDFRAPDMEGVAEIGKVYNIKDNNSNKGYELFYATEGNPLFVFNRFSPGDGRYAMVEQFGDIKREYDFRIELIRSSNIRIMMEISLSMFIDVIKEWEKFNKKISTSSDSPYSYALNKWTDECSITNEPYSISVSISSFSFGTAFANHRDSIAASIWEGSHAISLKDDSVAVSIGSTSDAVSEGKDSVAVASGDIMCRASVRGEGGVAICNSNMGTACAFNKNSIAISTEFNCYAKGVLGSFLVLFYKDVNGKILHSWTGRVGENGVLPGVMYRLNENGELDTDLNKPPFLNINNYVDLSTG